MRLPESLDLTGRVALVTGAGSPTGIGYAAARHLGLLGASVVVGATSSPAQDRSRELADLGITARAFVGDLTDPNAAEVLVHEAHEVFGAVDIVVNNAGMVSTSQPDYLEGDLLATTPERWGESLRRNLDTAFLVTRAALPHLRRSGHGRVVMVASVTGAVMGMRSEVAYAAAKAGLVGLTRALAVDEARHGSPSMLSPRGGSPRGRRPGTRPPRASPRRWDGRARPTRSPRRSPGWPAPERPTSTARSSSSTAATPWPRSGPSRGDAGAPARSQRGGILRAPSRRMTSPLSIGLSTMCATRLAYSAGCPGARGAAPAARGPSSPRRGDPRASASRTCPARR